MFAIATKIYQFKVKDSEIKKFPLCLGHIPGDFSANNIKVPGLNGCVYDFSAYCRTFCISNIIDIHKYLVKKTWYKIMFGYIKKVFVVLLTGIVSASDHTKCVLFSNQKCLTQPILINLHPNAYGQELNYYPFAVKLDRCVGSCNTLNDLAIRCVFKAKQKIQI